MSSRRTGLQGARALRLVLRRLPKEIRQEVKDEVIAVSKVIADDAQALAPVRDGDLASSITFTVAGDGLSSAIGPGARAVRLAKSKRKGRGVFASLALLSVTFRKADAWALWQNVKGYWAEFGTKGDPDRNIPPQPATPFMRPSYEMNRSWAIGRFRQAITRTLKKARRRRLI
ncbi:MAG: HK97 gp10 family phage protein [Pseudomonadota bacterium]